MEEFNKAGIWSIDLISAVGLCVSKSNHSKEMIPVHEVIQTTRMNKIRMTGESSPEPKVNTAFVYHTVGI